ncbi:hypothetical protein ACFL6I_23855 [candidate division KSB1 bacterium]
MPEWENIIDNESKLKLKIIKTDSGSKWSVVYLLYIGYWLDIVRIDNYEHEGSENPHIHRYKQKRVEFLDITFTEAQKKIKKIGKGIKERIKDDIY